MLSKCDKMSAVCLAKDSQCAELAREIKTKSQQSRSVPRS